MKVKVSYKLKITPSPLVSTEFELEHTNFGYSLRDCAALGEIILQLQTIASGGKLEVVVE